MLDEFQDFPFFKSGDQIRKKAESKINKAQLNPESLTPTDKRVLEMLLRNVDGSTRYRLTFDQMELLGF